MKNIRRNNKFKNSNNVTYLADLNHLRARPSVAYGSHGALSRLGTLLPARTLQPQLPAWLTIARVHVCVCVFYVFNVLRRRGNKEF